MSSTNEGPETHLPERLYLIQNDIYHYYAGHLSNGNQVLMDEHSRVEFDAEGNMLAAFSREIASSTAKAMDVDGNLLGVFSQTISQPDSMMLPFTPGTISIKAFFLEDLWLGVQELPEHYQDFLDHPENATEDDWHCFPEEISGWRECNNFVLWWNEDYFLNEDGELESS